MGGPAFRARTALRSLKGRLALLGLSAGALMGLVVGGIGGRLTMRLIAIGQHRQLFFTLRGSLTVVIAGTITGALVGLPYPFARRVLPGRGVARGLLYSLALQVIGAVVGFPLPLIPPGGRFTWPDVLPRLALSLLFFIGGAVLEVIVARIEPSATSTAATRPRVAG